jgi:hypothetical protein
VQLVDETRAQVLAEGGDSAPDAYIAPTCGSLGAIESVLNTAGDEVKYRAALHLERFAGVMREYERGAVIGRFLAPPALPVHVPCAASGAEHVATKNPRADIFETLLRHGIVDAGFTTLLPGDNGAKYPCREEPVHHRHEADAQRVLQRLLWSRTEPIERNPKRRDAYFGHDYFSAIEATALAASRNAPTP